MAKGAITHLPTQGMIALLTNITLFPTKGVMTPSPPNGVIATFKKFFEVLNI